MNKLFGLTLVLAAQLGGVAWGQTRAYKADMATYEREPTVREVQLAALRYYQVDDQTLKGQKSATEYKALVPSLSVNGNYSQNSSGDETRNDEYSSTTFWLANIASGTAFSVGGSLSWNLPNLVFSAETLAVQSRAGAREGILKEVTRIYYDRRRAQIAMRYNPARDEAGRASQQLKIDELTALLDAYTGGWFSKQTRGAVDLDAEAEE